MQLKSRAISGHMGPRFLCTIKRHAEYIHGEHSVLHGGKKQSGRTYTPRNKLDRSNRSVFFCFSRSSDAACLSCKDIRRFVSGIKGIIKEINISAYFSFDLGEKQMKQSPWQEESDCMLAGGKRRPGGGFFNELKL